MLSRPPASVLIAAGALDPADLIPSPTVSTDTVPRLNKYPRGCEICGKKVRSKMSETLHYKASHPDQPRPHRPDQPATAVVVSTQPGVVHQAPATVTVTVPAGAVAVQQQPQQVLVQQQVVAAPAAAVQMQQQPHQVQEVTVVQQEFKQEIQ